MRLVERTIEELNRSWNGNPWYGPALRPLLDGVTEEQARQHPVKNAHSILELVAHAAYWMDMTVKRIEGFTGEASDEHDWRDIAKLSWRDAVVELESRYIALLDRVARLNDEKMNAITQKHFTVYSLVNGLIQHNVYHAGQIALLKKAL
jgi:uncharacterized damage-inducible protein DinB